MLGAAAELERLNAELREALDDIMLMRRILPICAWCRRVRDDRGDWDPLEAYIAKRSEAQFSHGICPDCAGGIRKTTP